MLRKAFLEQSGYNVIGATTAEDALEILREAPVCATITDHFLHGTTGAKLAREMKKIKPDVPIIFYSGTVPDKLLGADVFINKNETVQGFLRIVGEVVGVIVPERLLAPGIQNMDARGQNQSSGGFSIPQTLPCLSSASPTSQNLSYSPREMQFTTRAVTPFLAGRPSNRTRVPISSG
jgi:DNA-binding NarL/FixJ family response regulator